MFNHLKGDQWLGLLCGVAALLLIFVWVPLDVDTGLVEKVRRQVTLGDSLGPVVAGVVILLGSIMIVLQPQGDGGVSMANLRWIVTLFLSVAAGLLVMRYVGPALVDLIAEPSYRALRGTPPWNYISYLLGGMVMIASLIALVRGRLPASALLIGLIASLVIALLYDLPFDDLQLPPNGDV